MVPDQNLVRKLLLWLQEKKKSMEYGDSILIQPAFDARAINPVKIDGYEDWTVIESYLKYLVENDLVETGIETDGPMIGIHFSDLREAGRRRALGLDT